MSLIGEIRFFGFGHVPLGWLPCDGRKVSAHTYPELAALLAGRVYGDPEDTDTVVLPFLQGMALVGSKIEDIPNRWVGYFRDPPGGVETGLVNLPMHSHATQVGVVEPAKADRMRAVPQAGDIPCRLLNTTPNPATPVAAFGAPANLTPMGPVIQPAGATTPPISTPMQPFLAMTACICAVGEFPTRP